MKGLIFAPQANSKGRGDASYVFVPGAEAFAAYHGISNTVWLGASKNRSLVIDSIGAQSGLKVVAYFGHGLRSGLPSADLWWKDLPQLAEAVRSSCQLGAHVILYACTAGLPGCFANQLSKLVGPNVTVWGHTCQGHGYFNPYVTRYPFAAGDSAYVVDPEKDARWLKWVRLIKGSTLFWARFPFLPQAALRAEIDSGKSQWIDI
mgnify:CR=1 FL=1|jgi:hypothetical protein